MAVRINHCFFLFFWKVYQFYLNHYFFLNDYGFPDPFNKSKSSIQDIAFDCKNMKFQFLNDKFFSKQMGKGVIIQSSNRPMPVMNMPKGSAYDIISKLVC